MSENHEFTNGGKENESLSILDINKKNVKSLVFKTNKISSVKTNRFLKIKKKTARTEDLIKIENQLIKFHFTPGTEMCTVRFTNPEDYEKISNSKEKDIFISRIYETPYKYILNFNIKNLKQISWE